MAWQQGTLTRPDTCFFPPFSDLLIRQMLSPLFPNLPCLFSTFHLEYPSILYRFCIKMLSRLFFWNIHSIAVSRFSMIFLQSGLIYIFLCLFGFCFTSQSKILVFQSHMWRHIDVQADWISLTYFWAILPYSSSSITSRVQPCTDTGHPYYDPSERLDPLARNRHISNVSDQKSFKQEIMECWYTGEGNKLWK